MCSVGIINTLITLVLKANFHFNIGPCLVFSAAGEVHVEEEGLGVFPVGQ